MSLSNISKNNKSLSGVIFVFTGKLVTTSRRNAKSRVEKLGGVCAANVTKKTNYLVIGIEGYEHFVSKQKSTKLSKAEFYRNNGSEINFLNEREFLQILSKSEASNNE